MHLGIDVRLLQDEDRGRLTALVPAAAVAPCLPVISDLPLEGVGHSDLATMRTRDLDWPDDLSWCLRLMDDLPCPTRHAVFDVRHFDSSSTPHRTSIPQDNVAHLVL